MEIVKNNNKADENDCKFVNLYEKTKKMIEFFFDPHKKVLFSKFFETGQKGSKGQILTLIKPTGIKTQNKAVDL